MAIYIHQLKDREFISLLTKVGNLRNKPMGKVELAGYELNDKVNSETLIRDVVQSPEIEARIYSLLKSIIFR